MTARQSRQSFLGAKNAEVLAGATVGVVGLCGGGSHICQQLAHAGVGRFVIGDFDRVDESNLNRMVGSCPADAQAARRKVTVIENMIRRINPAAVIVRADGAWQEHAMKFRGCSVIVGCVDRFSARDELERFCRRFLIPYVDIGMDVFTTSGGHSISGQVVLSVPGGPCLWCLGVLTQERLASEQKNYGAAGGRPQVVWPNGVLASIAVGQTISLLLPWNQSLPMHAMIEYDGNRHVARESTRLAILKDRPCTHFPPDSPVGDPFFEHSHKPVSSRIIGWLKTLRTKWKSRPRYSLSDMPTALVASLGGASWVVAIFYGFVITEVSPRFAEVANRTQLSEWGLAGWFVIVSLASLAYLSWIFGSIGWRCNNIIMERVFK